jgi:DNA-binding CsgD family transcriptional regulator
MPQPGWRLFWTAFKRSHNAMVLLDDDRRHVEVNGAYLALLSSKRSALIGRPIYDFVEGGRLMTDADWIALVALRTSRRRRRYRAPATTEGTVALTERELEIIEQVALGQTGREIAQDLHISHETVRTHVRNAQGKLGARSRAQLVALTLGDGYLGAHRKRAIA